MQELTTLRILAQRAGSCFRRLTISVGLQSWWLAARTTCKASAGGLERLDASRRAASTTSRGAGSFGRGFSRLTAVGAGGADMGTPFVGKYGVASMCVTTGARSTSAWRYGLGHFGR